MYETLSGIVKVERRRFRKPRNSSIEKRQSKIENQAKSDCKTCSHCKVKLAVGYPSRIREKIARGKLLTFREFIQGKIYYSRKARIRCSAGMWLKGDETEKVYVTLLPRFINLVNISEQYPNCPAYVPI